MTGHDELRNGQRKPLSEGQKQSSSGFLRAAGRTFSFGGQKKHLPPVPAAEEPLPPNSPTLSGNHDSPAPGRSRATTSSTATTVTAPRVDSDFDLDLGADFGKMLLGNDKRASAATLKDNQPGRQSLGPRSLTGNRLNQPAPINIDRNTKVEASPYSWSSNHSNDQLLATGSPPVSPPTDVNAPPVPRHTSPLAEKNTRTSASPEPSSRKPLLEPQSTNEGDNDDEEDMLLKDSLSTVTRFMSGKSTIPGSSTSRYRRNEDGLRDNLNDDESLFDGTSTRSFNSSARYTARPVTTTAPQDNKVMTPAEFEKYRRDKERQNRERQLETFAHNGKGDEDEEDNYEDDEDDLEKAKQQAKQRRKQEAHMAVYRQQMMKVTGESANPAPPKPGLQFSFSSPNLHIAPPQPSPVGNTSENSDEDEEVPLAILAAHGFPGKNRPPTRLSTMMSNPNLRAAQQPSYQRPGSAAGEAFGGPNPRLPAFARNLPQDPFLGAGLVRNNVRESFALGGGAPAPAQASGPVPPGGLIGVIAHEERNRAMRRGSPRIETQNARMGAGTFDPVAGVPPQMMYPTPNPMMLTPGDQAQIQMTQQMQQFLHMQMQFMQMVAGQNGTMPRPESQLGAVSGMPGVGGLPPMMPMPGMTGYGRPEQMRHSVASNDSMFDLNPVRGDAQLRTMSMVQPSSASWIQPPQNHGFAPSIRIQGGGYAPSIAPSERSNIGLPGRYRPVSHMPAPQIPVPGHLRTSSTMSGSIQATTPAAKSGNASDDDDEEGWEAMKAKREKKRSLWKTKKSIGGDIGALIS